MNTSSQIVPTLSDQISIRLLQAIDEAKLIKSKIKDTATKVKEGNPHWHRLISLNSEIMYLEAKLIQVRSMANRN